MNAPFHWLDVDEGRVSRSKEPAVCPHCGKHVLAQEVVWQPVNTNWKVSGIESVYLCPNGECGRYFLASFPLVIEKIEVSPGLPSFTKRDFKFSGTTPPAIGQRSHASAVAELSPQFVEIYGQAEKAEAHGLKQICGLGYRKAVEFLIKDHCIAEHPSEAEKIKAMLLGNCIKDYVVDANVKACAERAVWLGNDEAHYLRKWQDKDISDLKILIVLTSNWIESLALTKQYQASMPGKP